MGLHVVVCRAKECGLACHQTDDLSAPPVVCGACGRRDILAVTVSGEQFEAMRALARFNVARSSDGCTASPCSDAGHITHRRALRALDAMAQAPAEAK